MMGEGHLREAETRAFSPSVQGGDMSLLRRIADSSGKGTGELHTPRKDVVPSAWAPFSY